MSIKSDYSKPIIERASKALKQKISTKLHLAVSKEEQDSEINSLKEVIRYEKFFFVVDTINLKLENLHGVARWLGYDEATFTWQTYLSIIHPSYIEYLIHLAEITTNFSKSKDFRIAFRQHQYVVDVALRHSDGHYVLCKRSLTAWQWHYDNESQVVTHYMNEFTVTNPYIEEITPEMSPRVLDANGNKLHDIEALIRKNSQELVENEKKMFSVQELRILRKMAYNPTITSSEIATAFKTQVSTIHTLNKRIIDKGKYHFHDVRINNAKDLAVLLRRNFFV